MPQDDWPAGSAPVLPGYSGAVLGSSGADRSFRHDDGSADPAVAAAFAAFGAGQGGENDVLEALAGSRLLVPVVAVPAGQPEGEPEESGGPGGKLSEMAMPTLIGLDGRRAIPAFTCLASMQAWRQAARPVPVAARGVWQAAVAESCAVVVDVAGPVPLAVEGARLTALARGEAAPAPWSDPDVREIVADALAGQLDVAGFELRPAGDDQDLVIALTLAPGNRGRAVTEVAAQVANAVQARLGGRLRRGIAIWLAPVPAP